MNKLYNDTAVQAIANAIRAKNGSSDTYTIAEMSTALNDISYYAKPTISNVSLATFEADGLPLNSLKVSVEAKQAGSGTPSPENVRPISGWSEVNVSDVGKNLANQANFVQGGVNGQGEDTSSTIRLRSPLIEVNPSQTYALSVNTNLSIYEINNYDINGNWINYVSLGFTSGTYTPNNNVHYVKIIIRKTTNAEVTVSELTAFQLEIGTQATAYEPYINQTTTISLPQTVYGGEVDVVNGVLTITHDYIASYNGETLPSTWISSMDVYAEGTTPTTGAEVVYTLASSTTVSLTPSLIKSLNGTNNLSVDCGEVIELEYFKEV